MSSWIFTTSPSSKPGTEVGPVVPAAEGARRPLEPPAVLFNRLGDVLAYTSGCERIVRPIGLLDDELTVVAGASFADRMAAVPRLPRQGGVECLTRPEAGAVRLSYGTLTLPDADGRRLLVHLPADEASSAALDRLNGRRLGGLAASAR